MREKAVQEQLRLSEPKRNLCAVCGKLSGSISQGTGFPLQLEKDSGNFYHVRCRPVDMAAWRFLS